MVNDTDNDEDEITVTVTRKTSKGRINREYTLTDEFKEHIEDLARSRFEENEYVELWWSKDEPVLNIETLGPIMPWDYIDQISMVDMEEMEEDEGSGDTAYIHFPEDKRFIPTIEDDEDDDRMPEAVVPEPEDATYVIPQVEDGERGAWDVGRAMLPREGHYTWDVQRAINNAPTRHSQDNDWSSEMKERNVQLRSPLDTWEGLLVTFGCEYEEKGVRDGKKASQRKKDRHSKDKVKSGQIGNRWNV